MSRFSSYRSRYDRWQWLHLTLAAAGVCSLAVLAAPALWADITAEPPATHRRIARSVTQLMSQQHLTKHPFDNEINERWVNNLLKILDRRKLFFTQADVDSFMAASDQLDEMAKDGDTSFAYKVFRRFLERLDERVKLVDQLLQTPPDFTVDEELILDPDQIAYAKSEAEMRDRWRMRIKFDLLDLAADDVLAEKSEKSKVAGKSSAKTGELGDAAAREKISKRYHHLARRWHQTDNDDLLEMFLTAMTNSFDPHTSYMSPSTLDDFEIQMKLSLQGIGAQLEDPDGETTVKKVIPGGAAFKDGRLKPGDRITAVGQDANGPMMRIEGMMLKHVVKYIRGKQGTVVRLEVIPKGETQPVIYNIVRQTIELTDSEARSVILDAGHKPDGTPFRIGVINLPSFYMDMGGARANPNDFRSATRDVTKLLRELKQQKVDAVMVDLRFNGGGSLTEAVKLTGLFIDGCIVQVKDSDGQKSQFDDQDRGVEWDGPLVVLTSKHSASASEIFAGAIQDYKRGLIVGDTSTHGKGTVQSLIDLGQKIFGPRNQQPMGALKITEQLFYRPDGDSTQNRGVLADIELPSLTSQRPIGESSLDYAMKFDRVDPVAHQKFGYVDNNIVSTLRSASTERRKDSKDFQKLTREIDDYNTQKEKKRISLQKDKFLAEMAELKAEKHDEEEMDELNDPNRPVIKRDYYVNEVLDITADYIKLLKSPPAGSVGQTR